MALNERILPTEEGGDMLELGNTRILRKLKNLQSFLI
jgi:hypothetical protein